MRVQPLAQGTQLLLQSLTPGTVGDMAKNYLPEGGSGNVGVELAIHVRVEVETTGEAVSSQGE
ncbi:hypothetical protein [Gemmatimonas phototrophica]|uniref:hypothetical protein n=1 Tax=Gemmatimonas phototrophica TaxID=1379270 RepID=UPI00047A9F08|nr:hypothetical protein [Gemmatimonas phototrophica]